MALTNYTDLQAALGTWAFNRNDLPTDDLIKLAEARLNADLNLRNQTADYPLTGVIGSRFIALPTGYTEPAFMWIEMTWGRQELEMLVPGIDTVTNTGQPFYWAVEGEQVAFERPCDQAYSFTLRCRTALTLATTTTNWLMTNYPDCYLAAANVEAALWMQDDEQASRWESRYEAAIKNLKHTEAQSSRAPLRTEITGLRLNASPYNYNRGY